jgi:antitoxin HigA-1
LGQKPLIFCNDAKMKVCCLPGEKMRSIPKPLTTTEVRMPIHPGEILQEELLTPMGLSLSGLAQSIQVPVNRLNEIARGLQAVTPDTAERLSRYFGFSPDYWLQLQWRYDQELGKRRA